MTAEEMRQQAFACEEVAKAIDEEPTEGKSEHELTMLSIEFANQILRRDLWNIAAEQTDRIEAFSASLQALAGAVERLAGVPK